MTLSVLINPLPMPFPSMLDQAVRIVTKNFISGIGRVVRISNVNDARLHSRSMSGGYDFGPNRRHNFRLETLDGRTSLVPFIEFTARNHCREREKSSDS